ncbi:malic enzyme [Thecamonas trahens ATCC 50062]|uniref:Malic enzyme n=1 Tax=Thecamonas trahens ATCC 50062 TaxID=461836 RepID=A0A0L0DSB9_THETB|nr:malic enzyme [Thecamonas trahens ATCC 50062]KNC55165.1 malic enzyme [Thecamonas trahens ATCC 50062]|eukprot:XP_013753218.1 malic enzyme [Thecamonas trahens ATCC 50062]
MSATSPFSVSYSNMPSEALDTRAPSQHVYHGLASSATSRAALTTEGLLPAAATNLETEVARALAQMRSYETPLQKYIYLSDLAATSSSIFYATVLANLEEIMPLVYTPTVGEACQKFSAITRGRPQGLFITAEHKGRMREVLDSWNLPVHIIVVTDGSRILGLGDLGAGGMGIPIGKLSLYIAAGGFHPASTLPITLDFGTDSEELLADPLYIGLRQNRVQGDEYYALVDEFITAVKDKWPQALVQFEDFSNDHCFDLLDTYRSQLPCFNDDIQGTGAVIAAGFVVAARVLGVPISEHRCVFLGAGSAGVGVADRIVSLMVAEGLTEEEARARFWFIDSRGLVVKGLNEPMASHKIPYARTDVDGPITTLQEVIDLVKPTALVGLSKQAGVFTPEIIKSVHANCARPLIFPLSNPTSKSECTAETAYTATNGECLFASGSPFDPVTLADGRTLTPGQGNNCYVFPGIGMGTVLARASEVTEGMINAAVVALAECVTEDDLALGRIYPSIDAIRSISARIGAAVARRAVEDGVSSINVDMSDDELVKFVEEAMYVPDRVVSASKL